MAHDLILKCKGLYTAPNQLSGVPEGALAVADDVVIDQDNLAQSRRGFDSPLAALPLASDRINRFVFYKETLIAHWGTNVLGYYNGTAWVAFSGTYAPVNALTARTRFLEANQNLYLTSSVGIWKLDTPTGTPKAAGVPKGLDLQLALTGSTGFFTNNPQVTFTAVETLASANLTAPSSLVGLVVGQYVSGTNIPTGTKIASITQPVLVLSTTMSSTAGSNSIVVAVATGIANGQVVAGANIPTGTTVTGVAGTTITISANATATQTTTAVTFTTPGYVTMTANATTGTGSITVT
ncbi:MAG: hypothetical protein H0U59_14055, partial [Gemmatimonadaceae bacterium]|nr:hypothetical protein [Gemmatimonadaceae bacterium]